MRKGVPVKRGHIQRQRGYAMIVMLTVFALMSSYFIATGMSRTQNEVNIERDRQSLQSMQAAKAALIAYVGSQVTTTDGANDQPGALPCPSADEAGQAASTCSVSAGYAPVGRFPWKTIGTETLRDGSGQVLWYALSSNFRKASGTTVINSDTQGTLTVTGASPASNVVAVIIAPGNALSSQNRSTNTIVNYLESATAAISATNTATETFSTAQASETFNDQVVVITQADLMAVVEPLVASRIERDVKPYLKEYFSVDASNLGWNSFPFPATFASPTPGTSGSGTNRAQSTFLGTAGLTEGLLPIASSASYSWTAGSGTVSVIGGTASSTVSSISCNTSGTSWRCDFTLNALNSTATCGSSTRYCMVNPSFRVTGGIGSNAGLSFADLPTATSVTVTSTGGTSRTMSAKIIGGSLTAAGVGTVRFDGTHSYSRYNSSSFTRTIRVTIPVVTANPVTSSIDATAGWFTKNEWYRQTYYAVSANLLPGTASSCVYGTVYGTNCSASQTGGITGASYFKSACTAGTTCLTVNNLPSSYTTAKDKWAVLIFAGRAISGTRPSSSLASYFEGQNQTPSDNIFSHQTGTASTFNDRAIVLLP